MHTPHQVATFKGLEQRLRGALLLAPEVNVGEWQAQRGTAFDRTFEIEDVSFSWDLPHTIHELAEAVQPNRTWADEHFTERVGGVPLNPPPSAERWPYAQKAHAEHTDTHGRFSHTYPERFWPKFANDDEMHEDLTEHWGIRFKYGDLEDVVRLLKDRPDTRQAFIPIWFPEDTGAVHGGRVPCTLGYHFLLRQRRLKIVYYLRSCDFLRHFRDDVYLAARLVHWMRDRLTKTPAPIDITQTRLVMHISSLHVFQGDRHTLEYQHRKDTSDDVS